MLTLAGFLLLTSMAFQPTYAHADTIELQPFPIHQDVATTTEGIVREVQLKYGLGDDFYETAKCESQFNENALGDHNTSYGTWQIHLPAHPDISPKQALNARWSSEWAARQFLAHNEAIWTCWRLLN